MKRTIIASVLILILAALIDAGVDEWKKNAQLKEFNKSLTVDEVSPPAWQPSDGLSPRTITIKAHTATEDYNANCEEGFDNCPSVEVDRHYEVKIENGAICFIPEAKGRNGSGLPFWACYSVVKGSRRGSK